MNYVMFDLDTGGLSPYKNPIVEVALMPVGTSKGKYILLDGLATDSLVKPYADLVIEERALEKNGLAMEQILNGADSKAVVEYMIELFKILKIGRRRYPTLTGHNIMAFDIPFLEFMFKFHGEKLWSYVCRDVLDTYTLCKLIFGNNHKIDSMSLDNVCNFMGIRAEGKIHTAKEDTRRNARLFQKIANLISFQRNRMEYLSL